jgi:hypothetical protein
MTDSSAVDPIEEEGTREVDPEFLEALDTEADLVKSSIEEGISPMTAHARAIMWLDTLVKIHAVGLDQSLTSGDANQAAVWSRDLASLELSLALIQNVPPLKQPEGV